jgi:hypothetical protein
MIHPAASSAWDPVPAARLIARHLFRKALLRGRPWLVN